ncbi:hypothetical protein J6590_030833 [Homalodisca vitripennis]|nr:hypothetical protein J6590_030833 [Homalodisca vitripennis]
MVLWKVILSVVLALTVTLSATSAPVEYESQEESGLQEEENEYQYENGYQDRNEYNSMTSTTEKYLDFDPPTLPPTRRKHILDYLPPFLFIPFIIKGKKKPPKNT